MGIFWAFFGFSDGSTHANMGLTLSMLKNGKTHIFSVIEVLVHDSHLNTPYGQMGAHLMDRWFSNPFPHVTRAKSPVWHLNT